jgi:hypothetical protein
MQQQLALERTQAARVQALESRHTQQLQALAHPNPQPPPPRMAPAPPPQFHGNPVPPHVNQASHSPAAPPPQFHGNPPSAHGGQAPHGHH